jgi:lycopene beta-cyclase
VSDVVLVGGGLANGLIALGLKRARPERRVLLVERTDRVGGSKTWSFHEGDVEVGHRAWLDALVTRSWPGYGVRFPRRRRRLERGYHSIRSGALHAALAELLGDDLLLGRDVVDVAPGSVRLADGLELRAACVLDGRGQVGALPYRAAYQKFLGVFLALAEPAAPTEPLLMDATVAQRDGFRFVYALPWTERSLLVEDTYYSESPLLDRDRVRSGCLDYAAARGWPVESIEGEEAGVLPIPLDGDFEALRAGWPPGVPAVGTRAGLFHPTTGYSLPDAVRTADALARLEPLDTARALALVTRLARDAWDGRRYFRLLNRLMFEAAEPEDRYRVLEHFYGMPEELIQRFYAARLRPMDRLRILSGRPPVPLSRAALVLARSAWTRATA